jgi:hypothetical protein
MGLPFAHGSLKRRIKAALWRLRHLNLVTTPDKYPLPNMQDFSNGLRGCSVFSKINTKSLLRPQTSQKRQ